MYEIRDQEYSSFAKVANARAENAENKEAYRRMETETELIKKRLEEAKKGSNRNHRSDVQDAHSDSEDPSDYDDEAADDEEADFYDKLSD